MKKCPFCAEEIQDDALKCRFCGEFFKRRKKWFTCLYGCLIAFALFLVFAILFSCLGFIALKYITNKISTYRQGFSYALPSLPSRDTGIDEVLKDFKEMFGGLWDGMRDTQSNSTTY